jgi:hypothetical protein
MRRFSLLSILLPIYMFAASMPEKALYLQGQSDKGIILAHGKGMNPDFKVVKPFRLALNKDIGFHTLSLQMPNQYEAYEDYEPTAQSQLTQISHFLNISNV